MSKIGRDILKTKPRLIWEHGKGWRTPEQVEQEKIVSRRYPTKCPVCGEPSKLTQTSSTKGFKGARYEMNVYDHPDKECVLQKAHYPDYFGKGPKTRVYKWTRGKKLDKNR